MSIEWVGVDKLSQKLIAKSQTDFIAVGKKNIRDIYARSQKSGGTPVGDYTGGGQLRISAKNRNDEIGYSSDYAAHVEYGHVTRGGTYVPGQYYLKRNVDTQRPIYKEDLRTKLKE